MIVKLITPRVTSRMDMADDVVILAYTPDHIAIHHLHVINVKQQLYMRGIDALNYVRNIVDVVALIARMALHRVRVVAGVELLQAQGDVLSSGILSQFREGLYRIGCSFRERDLSTLWIF